MRPANVSIESSYIQAKLFNSVRKCSPCVGRLLAIPVCAISLAISLVSKVAELIEAVVLLIFNFLAAIFRCKNRCNYLSDAGLCLLKTLVIPFSIVAEVFVVFATLLGSLAHPKDMYTLKTCEYLAHNCRDKYHKDEHNRKYEVSYKVHHFLTMLFDAYLTTPSPTTKKELLDRYKEAIGKIKDEDKDLHVRTLGLFLTYGFIRSGTGNSLEFRFLLNKSKVDPMIKTMVND